MRQPRGKDELSDKDLLRLSARGDEDAFLMLYRRHQGPVFRFALHMSGRRDTAEEVTQEVFLAMLAGARQYVAERGPLEALLIGIARNQVRRHLRQLRAIPADHPGVRREFSSESSEQLDDELSKEEELSALRAAILALPPNYRAVIVLCDLEDVDYAEAAVRLGCAVGTVRSRLHRARAILQAKLGKRERCSV